MRIHITFFLQKLASELVEVLLILYAQTDEILKIRITNSTKKHFFLTCVSKV